jgi:hypothetical protein
MQPRGRTLDDTPSIRHRDAISAIASETTCAATDLTQFRHADKGYSVRPELVRQNH